MHSGSCASSWFLLRSVEKDVKQTTVSYSMPVDVVINYKIPPTKQKGVLNWLHEQDLFLLRNIINVRRLELA